MIIDQRVIIEAPVESVWAFTGDVPAVARCLPGVQEFEQEDEDTYTGALRVKVGPVEVRLSGRLRVAERDADELRARLEAEAADRRIRGAVKATSTLRLEPGPDGTTALAIHTDAAVLGKLGEFGQAVMRRKANQLLQQFARNMSRSIAERTGQAEETGTEGRHRG